MQYEVNYWLGARKRSARSVEINAKNVRKSNGLSTALLFIEIAMKIIYGFDIPLIAAKEIIFTEANNSS